MKFHDPRNAFANFKRVYAELHDFGEHGRVWVFTAAREELARYREYHRDVYGQSKPLAAVTFRRKTGPVAYAAMDRMFALHPDLKPPIRIRNEAKRIPIE